MFNHKLNFAALLISLLALSRETVSSCTDSQYLSNGTCFNCTSCGARTVLEQCTINTDTVCSNFCREGTYLKDGSCVACSTCDNPVLEQCTNITDTVCSPCSKGFRPNADGNCDFDCEQCSRQSQCVDESECRCFNGFSGIICDIPPPPTTQESSADPTTGDLEEDSGNRVVLIISIIVACSLTLVILIGIVVGYYKCSKRPLSHDSENSDESTYSSMSINSRTMLTNGHRQSNGSLQADQQSNGHTFIKTILPPPEPWNNNIASAIK